MGESTAHCGVQNGPQSWAGEVDARGDVCDEAVGRVRLLERPDPTAEVGSLVGRGDSCVDDALFLRRWEVEFVCAEEGGKVVDIVQALARGELDVTKFALTGPSDEGLVGDVKVMSDGRRICRGRNPYTLVGLADVASADGK